MQGSTPIVRATEVGARRAVEEEVGSSYQGAAPLIVAFVELRPGLEPGGALRQG